MKFYLMLTCLIITGAAYGQKITAKQEGNNIEVKWQDKKLCKYMYIQKLSNRCNRPLLYYTPLYSCNGKKIPKRYRKEGLNFKDDMPIIREMMDSAKQFMVMDLCMVNINMGDYNDLMTRLVDKFAASEEWKKSLERRGKKENGEPDFDYGLILKLIRDEGVLDPFDTLLNPYGMRVARPQIEQKDIRPLTKAELKKLGKDENLLIPSPDPLWIQLSAIPND